MNKEWIDAETVVIELGDRQGTVDNLKHAASGVIGGLDAFLSSVALRTKYEFMEEGRVLTKNYVGWLPKRIVYDGRSLGWDTPYTIIEVVPEGAVKVTEETTVQCTIVDSKKRYSLT